jgi:hypothetical protein
MDMHVGQLNVAAGTVRELVDAQFPGWRDLPVWYYVDSDPPMSRMGRRTLARILEDERS